MAEPPAIETTYRFLRALYARELRREHVRIVQANHQSVALNMLYPYPEPKARIRAA